MHNTVGAEYNLTPQTFTDKALPRLQADANGNLMVTGPLGAALPVTVVEGIGSIAWGPPTPVAVTAGPTSTVLIAANAARKGLMIINPIGNAQMSYDLSGGVVTLAGGIPLLGGDRDVYTGADTPLTSVTFIGTAAQNLLYSQGT